MTISRTVCLLALLVVDKIARADSDKHQVLSGLADVDEDNQVVPEAGGSDSTELVKKILIALVATAVLALVVLALYRWK